MCCPKDSEEYIKSYIKLNIPAKEAKLLRLVKKNLGKAISKDEISDYIWKDDLDSASNWALNALIYRLIKA
ncbi:winged helix-turn-helix domain-containing protein [Candidatus Daviesbacteria bacterium]|nr:winged helix-turn-helix domain-containing protein [Candidatus Daviesbacteria bacterium]